MQQLSKKTNIKEIFSSIQGEGLYVGQKHLFIRFCRCNLACNYCDTDFSAENSKEYSIDELYEEIKNLNCDAISFTGGEPLMEKDFLVDFLKKYKTKLNKKIYLETNGTMYENLAQVIDYIDIVSMDIKSESSTKQKNRFNDNEKFIQIAHKKELFIKVVFDNNISDEEIKNIVKLAKKFKVLIVLQPKMPIETDLAMINVFDKFYDLYNNIRLIPQMHKFLNLA